MDTWDFILRLIVASCFGALIGLDREYRAKEAGLRTHFLVCLGSALFMLVSQHGFRDTVNTPGVALDPSRIAAQVVSGIGRHNHYPETIRKGIDYRRRTMGNSRYRTCYRRRHVLHRYCRSNISFGRPGTHSLFFTRSGITQYVAGIHNSQKRKPGAHHQPNQ